MKIKFQPYQTAAIEAVVDCFAGQPYQDALGYLIDPDMLQTKVALEVPPQQFNYGAAITSDDDNADLEGCSMGKYA